MQHIGGKRRDVMAARRIPDQQSVDAGRFGGCRGIGQRRAIDTAAGQHVETQKCRQ